MYKHAYDKKQSILKFFVIWVWWWTGEGIYVAKGKYKSEILVHKTGVFNLSSRAW